MRTQHSLCQVRPATLCDDSLINYANGGTFIRSPRDY